MLVVLLISSIGPVDLLSLLNKFSVVLNMDTLLESILSFSVKLSDEEKQNAEKRITEAYECDPDSTGFELLQRCVLRSSFHSFYFLLFLDLRMSLQKNETWSNFLVFK